MGTFHVLQDLTISDEGPVTGSALAHLRQGDMGGACGPYCLMMCLQIIGVIGREEATSSLSLDGRTQIGKLYKSHLEKERVLGWAEELDVDPSTTRSSFNILEEIFDEIDVDVFFEKVDLDEAEIKTLCNKLEIDSKGRKGDLIGRIIEYIDNPQGVEIN